MNNTKLYELPDIDNECNDSIHDKVIEVLEFIVCITYCCTLGVYVACIDGLLHREYWKASADDLKDWIAYLIIALVCVGIPVILLIHYECYGPNGFTVELFGSVYRIL